MLVPDRNAPNRSATQAVRYTAPHLIGSKYPSCVIVDTTHLLDGLDQLHRSSPLASHNRPAPPRPRQGDPLAPAPVDQELILQRPRPAASHSIAKHNKRVKGFLSIPYDDNDIAQRHDPPPTTRRLIFLLHIIIISSVRVRIVPNKRRRSKSDRFHLHRVQLEVGQGLDDGCKLPLPLSPHSTSHHPSLPYIMTHSS